MYFSRHFCWLFSFVCLLALAEPATAGIQQQGNKPVPWTTKDDVNRMVVLDVDGNIGHLLENEILSDFSAKFSEILDMPADGFTTLKDQFEVNKKFFPKTVKISEDGTTSKWFTTLIGFGVLSSYGEVQQFFGDEESGKEIEPLLKSFIKLADADRLPGITLAIEWESQEVSELILDAAKQNAPLATAAFGLKSEVKENGLIIRGKLSNIVDSNQAFNIRRFIRKGWLKKEVADEFRELIDRFHIEVQIEKVGSAIVLNIGKNRELVSDVDFKVPKVGEKKSLLAFGKTDLTNFKSDLQRLQVFCERWEGGKLSDLFKENVSSDDPAQIGVYTINSMTRYPEKLSFHFTGDGKTLEMRALEVGAPIAAATIKKSGLLRFCPNSAKLIQLDSRFNLGEHFSNSLIALESRIDRQVGRRGGLAGQISESYYSNFSIVRNIVYRDLPEVFVPPFALMMVPPKKLDLTIQAESTKFDFSKAVVPGFAFVSKCKDIEKTETILAELSTEFTIALFGALGLETEDIADGLFVPGAEVQGKTAWWFDVKAVKKKGVEIQLDGDFHPHYFFFDGYVIFSTSKQFSKDILNRKNRFVVNDENIVELVRMKGQQLEEMIKGFVTIQNGFIPKRMLVDPRFARVNNLYKAMEFMPRVVDEIYWDTQLIDGNYQTKAGVKFQKVK